MTEAEWLAATDPTLLLYFFHGRLSDRKLWLFACACCRVFPGAMPTESCHQIVAACERFADGREDRRSLKKTRRAAWESLTTTQCLAPWHAADPDPWLAAVRTAEALASHLGEPRNDASFRIRAVLRDLFGNPFRAVAADPAWLTSTVVQLARGIYEERAFDRLPILADALQDTGCENADVLDHCRGDGPHARGCWVVDLVLGKS